ncbi:protein of unknown function [Ruminococcaceae bacterium FB2012]|nr:protein of unknown function [Ruminococcaceae bacterium FB2012]
MTNKTLSSVKCGVESCVHNVEGKECSADCITVGSTCSCADCSDDTLCRTFKSREN